ncbi:DUF5916 domain-containing protein [Thermomonas brevis]
MERRLKPTALVLALLLCAPFAQAQTIAATHIPRLQGEIVVDGELDDAAWAQAQVVDIAYEVSPGDNIPAPQQTTVRIGHDDDALYVAFDARDTDPARIRAYLRDRDAAFDDDWVGLFMDTFDDQRRAYEFFVNPLGVQMDLIKDETNGGNEDSSWDGLWSSAGKVTAHGYQVELRIPFSTLRFRNMAGMQRWGIGFFRNYPRGKRHQLMSNRVPRGGNCLTCTLAKYEGMEGARQGRNLEIVPSLTVGRPETRGAAGQPWRGDGFQVEPGLDVSWAPTPNTTLNATLNPDFSQVESDQAQLDLNQSFALYFDEKRPFFMEGADYFNTPLRVLYTRQIADPDAGLRITGRSGSDAYGALVARDAVTQLLLPGALGSGFTVLEQPVDVAVGRYRRNLNAHATVGVIGTFRRGEGYSNDVVGVDGRWQTGRHTLTTQLLASQSEYPAALGLADDSPSGKAVRAYYGYNSRHWSFNSSHERIDPGFRADLGFIGMVGYRKSLLGGGRTWFRDGKAFNRFNLYADWDATHRSDGQLLENEFEASFNVRGPLQSDLNLIALTRERYWNGTLFDESYAAFSGSFRPRGGMLFGVYLRGGPQLDLTAARRGQGRHFETWSELDLSRSLSLNWSLVHQRLRRDGGTAFNASLADLRLGWQIDTRQRVRLALQGNRIERDTSLYAKRVDARSRNTAAQLIYSYKVNPRTAFYAGTSFGAFMDDANPELFGNSRSLFLKFSYGWQP